MACLVTSNQLVLAQCSPPVLNQFSHRTQNSLRVNWLYQPGTTAYELEVIEENQVFTAIPNSGIVLTNYYVIQNLKPNTRYCLRIRSVCNNQPGSWSAPYCFISNLSNPGVCQLDFNLQDATNNSDPVNNRFFMNIQDFPGAQLGTNLFIENVELIVEHDWPNDLDVELTSPSGITVLLAQQAGKGTKHFGDPASENCMATIKFSDEACQSVEDASLLQGELRPKQTLATFYDQSEVQGNWILNIRDNKYGHAGKLKYFSIQFAQNSCRLPAFFYVEPIAPNRASLRWDTSGIKNDSLLVEFGPAGFNLGSGSKFKIPAQNGQVVLTNLNPSVSYEAYIKTSCYPSESVVSCSYVFEPICHAFSVKDKFDQAELCANDCESTCHISPYWRNAGQNYKKWLVNSGKTNTEETGPKTDFFGFGKYIYAESSENTCEQSRTAVLESRCFMIVSNQDGCDFQFSYHMYGADIGTLSLVISLDEGENWEELFIKTGNQGNQWQTERVDLRPYQGKVARFRWIAELPQNGERSDIALDELIFFGSFPVNEANYTFYEDSDNDGFGNPETGSFFCWNDQEPGYVTNNKDCDDTDPEIHPEADEIPCNGVDENCNGMEDDLDLLNPMQIEVIAKTNESCEGSKNGLIRLNVTGGVAPYAYIWNTGGAGPELDQLSAGAYQCLITDANGCVIHSEWIEIKAGQPLEIRILEQSIASCSGTPDGYIHVGQTGGVEPVLYQWNTGHQTSELTGAGPGIYQVTITDALGCTLASPEIELKAATIFDIGYTISSPLCHGDQRGRIQIIGVLNGTPPYSYLWSTGSAWNHIDNLEPGYYSVTVSDSGQCYQVLDSLYVPETTAIEYQLIAKDDVTCFGGSNGSIEVNAKGGTPPYNFQWFKNEKLFSTNDDLFYLSAGKYQLILSDNNGCETSGGPIIIYQPDPLDITVDQINHPGCRASGDGSIDVSVTGGSGEYQFFWNGSGSGGSSYSNLNPGLYALVVTDKNGCKGFRNGIELNSLNIPIQNSLTITDSLRCFGDRSAGLKIEVEGVKPPLDYNWSFGRKHITDEFSDTAKNIGPGLYNVTITDAAGCYGSSQWIEITQPPVIQYSIRTLRDILCYGDNTGSLEIVLSGGVMPYSIIWNNGAEEYLLTDLAAAYYSASVMDANNCVLDVDSLLISQPDQLKLDILVHHANPDKNNGEATVIPYGGVSPYYYQWDAATGFQTSRTATGLAPGIYFVTVTDYNGCETDTSVQVSFQSAVQTTDNSGLKVWPNPAYGTIRIAAPDVIGKNYHIQSFNSQGKMVYSGVGNFGNLDVLELDILDWNPGIYYFILTVNGKQYRNRFIRIE